MNRPPDVPSTTPPSAAPESALPASGRRTLLRRLRPADHGDFLAYRSDPAVGRYQGWAPMTPAEAAAFIAEMATAPLLAPGEWVQLAIAVRDPLDPVHTEAATAGEIGRHPGGEIGKDRAGARGGPASGANGDRLIGDVGLCLSADGAQAEIGFTLDPRHQGRGLATDAVQAAIALVFAATSAQAVVGITDARNTPSARLMARAGLRHVATAPAVFKGEACVEDTYRIERPPG